jgi:hypothetical protein
MTWHFMPVPCHDNFRLGQTLLTALIEHLRLLSERGSGGDRGHQDSFRRLDQHTAVTRRRPAVREEETALDICHFEQVVMPRASSTPLERNGARCRGGSISLHSRVRGCVLE